MSRVRVLGLTLTGPEPVGRVHLRLEPGVTALYGLNGAGKSTILRGLAAALMGFVADRGGDADLHLVVDGVDDVATYDDDPELLRELLFQGTKFIDEELNALGGPAVVPEEFGLDDDRIGRRPVGSFLLDEASVGRAVGAWLHWLAEADESGTSHALAREIARQGLFTLRARGIEWPEWEVFISARPDDAAPALSALFAEQRALHGAVGDDLPVGDESTAASDGVGPDSPFEPEGLVADVSLGIDVDPWVPYPIARWGRTGRSILDWPPVVLTEDLDPLAITLRTLTVPREDGTRDLIDALDGDDFTLTEGANDALVLISHLANEYYKCLQLDPPELECQIVHPRYWPVHHQVQWTAIDRAAGGEINISDLGDMHRRWAQFAIGAAARETARGRSDLPAVGLGAVAGQVASELNLVGLIDEPERASHPIALRHLRRGLVDLARRLDCPIVICTHAAEFLGDPEVRLLHVTRSPSVMVHPMPLRWRETVGNAELGLAPTDVLQTVRAFLIVEGEHDRAVIDVLLGDELAAHGVTVLAARGVRGATGIIDAQMIVEFTDVPVVVAFDNTATAVAEDAWARALAALSEAGPRPRAQRQATRHLEVLRSRGREGEALYELCRRAISAGREGRIRVSGLSEPDVIEYLPVRFFLPTLDSWQEAVEAWGRRGDFKDWLRAQGASVGVNKLREAAEGLDAIPADFNRLLDSCISAAAGVLESES